MSEEKFTQGEWNKRGCTVYCKGIPIARTENPKENSLLGYVYGDKTILECEIGQYQAQSNADLIAAAPDMYRSLRDLVDMLSVDRKYVHLDEVERATKVLSKARGEL